jgi:DNA-directed RNA polymerase specialized sigma24 family protein
VADNYESEVAELQAIAQGNQEAQDAFNRWFGRCEIRLKRSLRDFASVVDVEAVVQDTALLVWERAATISPERPPGFLFRWAVTVAKNKARNNAKRAGRQLPLDGESQPADSSPLGDPLLRSQILKCRERLSPHQQRVVTARCEDGGTREDRGLAASIDMSFEAFRQNLARARKALVKCLRSFNIDVMEHLR